MLEAILIVLLVAVVPVAVAAATWLRTRRQAQGWHSLQAVRIIVNLKSGQSIDGYLVRQETQLLFIRDAVLIGQSDDPIPMDGQVIIERSEIEFTQSP